MEERAGPGTPPPDTATDSHPATGDERHPVLRVLIVEDEPADADLMIRALRKGGFDARCEVVDSEAGFLVALRTRPDVVLADYTVPGFGAIPALAILAEEAPEVPLLVVSGTITDETAVATLRAGAADFLIKDRLGRLTSAVSAAVERHRLQRERDRAEHRLSTLAANMTDLLFSVRLRPLSVDYVTPSVREFSGHSEAEVRRNPHLFPLFQPDAVMAMATTGMRETSYEVGRRKVWVDVRGTPITDDRGGVLGFQGVARDVSEARAAREMLACRARESSVVAGLGQDILDGASLDTVLWRAAEGLGRALDVELSEVLELLPGAGELRLRAGTGWDPRLLGEPVLTTDMDSQETFTLATRAPVVLTDAAHETRFALGRLPAERDVVCGITALVNSGDGAPFGVLGAYSTQVRSFTVEDVNFVQTVANVLTSCLQREDAARRSAAQSMVEPVTGLPTRQWLLDGLRDLLAQSSPGRPVVVAAVNVDRYADVRDAFGQAVTDHFLATLGRRLWQMAGEPDIVAVQERGHLYAVHLADAARSGEGDDFAERLLDAFDEPVYHSGQELRSTGSIGKVVTSGPQTDMEELLRRADVAMRRAVELGGDRVEVYAPGSFETGRTRLDRTIDLRRGIDSGEMRVLFQPVVHLRTNQVVGAEALVRWDHPTVGLLPPGSFLPAAEDAGLTADIGRAVQSRVWPVLGGWTRSDLLSRLHLAVNVAPRELARPGFVESFLRGLEEADAPPDRVWLELTEESLSEEAFLGVLRTLQDAGVTLAVDDFGTRYSSLTRVRDTHPGYLKVDQSFVAGAEHGHSDRAMIDATVHIAAALGAGTVAEGVEDRVQEQIVIDAGCDLAQGFYFSPPLPQADFEELVTAGVGVLEIPATAERTGQHAGLDVRQRRESRDGPT